MGIYDREYYRDKTRGSGWLSGAAPGLQGDHPHQRRRLHRPEVPGPGRSTTLLRGQQRRRSSTSSRSGELLTATFLHANPWHILMNMLFLWMVGREMESFYGTRDFVALYVSAAIVSTLAGPIVDAFEPQRRPAPRWSGPPGAVMAVVVLYTLYYPRREVLLCSSSRSRCGCSW